MSASLVLPGTSAWPFSSLFTSSHNLTNDANSRHNAMDSDAASNECQDRGLSVNIPNVDLLTHVFGPLSRDSDEPIFIDALLPSRNLSTRQARSTVKKLIAGLRSWGVRRGDAVCMHCFNSIYYAVLYLAIIGCGARHVGTNPAYTQTELTHILRISETKFIIAESELLGKIEPSARECGIGEEHMLQFKLGDKPEPNTLQRLLDCGEEHWVTFDDEQTAKTLVASLMMTSGTTGLPKAAQISHYALVAQSQLINADMDLKPYKIKRLLSLPQFHAFAGPLMNISPLLKGIPTYVMRKFDLTQFKNKIREYKINETAIVNPILLSLVNMPRDHDLDSLRKVWIAGARLDGATQNKFRDLLSANARVGQVWGMTEVGWITALLHPEKDSTGTVGRLLPTVEAKILGENGEEIGDDDVSGEFYVKSPCLMNGYLSNDEANEKTIVDGWLCTGDVGYKSLGRLYITDRAKDIIKVRGWQVSPAEVEACLLSHAAICDAVVVGVNPTGFDEQPRAFIVLHEEALAVLNDEEHFLEVELMEYLAQHLSKYKLPTAGIVRCEALPRSVSGKVLKHRLPKA